MSMAYQPKTYHWRVDNLPVDPQSAGEHIAQLEVSHKQVTPQIVLDDSRPSDATLHKCFEWDDNVAAEKYRLGQARYIIGNLVVSVVRKENSTPNTVRAFVSVEPRNKKGAFVSIDRVLSHQEHLSQVLQNAIDELSSFRQKYSTLKELSDVFHAIDSFLEGKQ